MKVHDVAIILEDQKKTDRKRPSRTQKAGRLKSKDLELMTRTLGSLLEGGVPLLKALQGLENVASNKRFKEVLAEAGESVRQGASFSDALRRTGQVPAIIHQTIYAGEVSGQVPLVLNELAAYLEREQSLLRSIRDALVYPAFILAVGLATLGVLTGLVLPRLKTVYEGFETELPFITTMVLGISGAYPYAVGFLVLLVLIAARFLKNHGQDFAALYASPFMGTLVKAYVRARFARLLALLLESGIPILEALDVAAGTFGAGIIRNDIAAVRTFLASGRSLSESINKLQWIDPLSRMLVSSGEEVGRLSDAFTQIARDTESTLQAQLELMVKLLEPALIVIIGVTVGFVVVATMLPIFDMSSLIQ